MSKRQIISLAIASGIVASSFVVCPVFAEETVDIEIVEVVDDGNGNFGPWQDITGAMPGETYSAIPRVRNDGTVPTEVSMCLSESVVYASGETHVLTTNAFEIEIDPNWTLDYEANQPGMTTGDCYKYNSAINAGNVSEPLFREVKLNASLGNEYESATFTLHLDARGISSEAIPVPDSGAEDTGAPDTGRNTSSYLEIVSPVFYTAGILAFLAALSFLCRRLLRK